MRWKSILTEEDLPYRNGKIRVIRRFLFWPKRLGNTTRFLEWAKIKQEYRIGWRLVGSSWPIAESCYGRWYDLSWED